MSSYNSGLKYNFEKLLASQQKANKYSLLGFILGITAFILIASFSPLNDKVLKYLYPKTSSMAFDVRNWKSYDEQIKAGKLNAASTTLEVNMSYNSQNKPVIEVKDVKKKNGAAPQLANIVSGNRIELIDNQGNLIESSLFNTPDLLTVSLPLPWESPQQQSIPIEKTDFTITIPNNEKATQLIIKDPAGNKIAESDLKKAAKIDNKPQFHSIKGDDFLKYHQSSLIKFDFLSPPKAYAANNGYLDIVFIGDDYSDLALFHNDINRFIAHILSYEPFKSRSGQIVLSFVDNTSDLGCAPVSPASYQCNSSLVAQQVNNSGVEADFIYVIVNNGTQGAGTTLPGYIGQGYNGNYGPQSFVHEMGHLIGGLYDEYLIGGGRVGSIDNEVYGNCYAGSPPASSWQNLAGGCDYTAGCNNYSNWYSPSLSSIMKSLDSQYFNNVAINLLNQKIDNFVGNASDPCPGKHTINGSCDAACCSNDSQCPVGQSCSLANGNCQSNSSCKPSEANPTPINCNCSYNQICTTSTGQLGYQSCNGVDNGSNQCIYDSSGSCSASCGACKVDSSAPPPTPVPGTSCGCTYPEICTTSSGASGLRVCNGITSTNGACVWDSSGQCQSNCTVCSVPAVNPTPIVNTWGACGGCNTCIGTEKWKCRLDPSGACVLDNSCPTIAGTGGYLGCSVTPQSVYSGDTVYSYIEQVPKNSGSSSCYYNPITVDFYKLRPGIDNNGCVEGAGTLVGSCLTSGFSPVSKIQGCSFVPSSYGTYCTKSYYGGHAIGSGCDDGEQWARCSFTVKAETPKTPAITNNIQCVTSPYSTNQITISWTNGKNPVLYADISTRSDFSVFWNKYVGGSTFTTAPEGFSGYIGVTGNFVAQPGVTYYVRLFNGTHSSVMTFKIPQCPTYGSQYLGQSCPSTLLTGETFNYWVQMRNTGTNSWSTLNTFLGSQNPVNNTIWGSDRGSLSSNVTNGNLTLISMNIKAPLIAGTYNFQWKLLNNTYGWFGDTTSNCVVNVVTPKKWIINAEPVCANQLPLISPVRVFYILWPPNFNIQYSNYNKGKISQLIKTNSLSNKMYVGMEDASGNALIPLGSPFSGVSYGTWFSPPTWMSHFGQDLPEGEHNIKFLAPDSYCYQDPAGYQSRFVGEYWTNTGVGGSPTFPTTKPNMVRLDEPLSFNWGAGSPDKSISADHFIARWTKKETFLARSYTFTITADDGFRLYIDGEKILDKWFDQGPTTYSVNYNMTAGTHTIMVEYYENNGDSSFSIGYSYNCIKPAAPAFVSPVSSIASGTRDITWAAVTGATGYALSVEDREDGGSNCTATQGPGDICTKILPGSQKSYPYNFQAGHSYFIYVQAIADNNLSCIGPAVSSFTSVSPITTPTPTPTPSPTPISIPVTDGKKVFRTSTSYTGNLGGLTGADAKCQERANAAGLTGNYKAWLSDSVTSASSRLYHATVPYVLVNGAVVANNWADLTDGSINTSINLTELNKPGGATGALTNTLSNGNIRPGAYHCSNWTSTSGSGAYGYSTHTDSRWTDYLNYYCFANYSLLCFEQETPPTPTPTPSPTPTPTPVPCTITSASWSSATNPVSEGEIVTLRTTTNGNCNNKSIAWNIWEDDGLLGRNSVRNNPPAVAINNNSAEVNWISEYQEDGISGIAGLPEYYFEANVVGDNIIFKSAEPKVQVKAITPFIPVITLNKSCSNLPYSDSEVTIYWTNPNNGNPVSWIDISSNSSFNSFYHKEVISTNTQTSAPTGFNGFQGVTGFLSASPNTVYYVRLFNGSHSPTASFNIPICPTPTPTPTATPVPSYIKITYPANNQQVLRNAVVNILAEAKDSLPITKVEFYVNNSLVCTDTTASYSCRWVVPSKRSTTFTITAKSVNSSGRSQSTSIKVYTPN